MVPTCTMQVCAISSSQHTLSLEGLSRRGLQQQTIRYLVGTCMCFHSTSVIGVHGITLPPESDPLLQSTLICYLLGILLILSAENDNKIVQVSCLSGYLT